jgi:hypothetical protein
MKRVVMSLAVGSIFVCVQPTAVSQDRGGLQRVPVQQMEQVQMPGALPEITSISPVGPDGSPYLRPGETFVITGKNFAPGKTTIGIRTWVAGEAAIPPQSHDFVASVNPAVATPQNIEAIAPGGVARGVYLLWVHVQGAGHGKPVPIQFSPKAAAPANPPKISSVKPSPPDLMTTISGSNFGGDTMVIWPVGLSEVAEFVSSTTIRARVPKGLKPGTYKVSVEVNGVHSPQAQFTVLDPMPLNLYWDETDLNGIPLNPRWGWQLVRPYDAADYYPDIPTLAPRQSGLGASGWWPFSSLTDQKLYTDRGWFNCGPHVNWEIPVTYEGFVRWSSHSPPCWEIASPCDDDYNFYFFPHEGAGATDREGSRGGIMTEFDSAETIDYFHTEWWNDFQDAVDDSDASARAMVDRKWSIATALMGLDCAHDCWSEIHPVWAMAIHVKEDPADDRWSIFVRNWGNQGFCGTDQHLLDLPTEGQELVYKLRIPWRPGATAVSWNHEFLQRGNIGLHLKAVPGTGVIASFFLPKGANKPRINGQLRLRWIYPSGQSPQPYDRSRSAWVNVSNAVGIKVSEEVDIYRKGTSALTSEQRAQFDAKMVSILSRDAMIPDSGVPLAASPRLATVVLSPTAPIPGVRPVPDADKVQRIKMTEQAAREVGAEFNVMPLKRDPGSRVDTRPIQGVVAPSGRPDVSTLQIEGRAINQQPTVPDLEYDVNRAGGDYRNFDLPEPRPELCRDSCVVEEECRAFTYVKPGIQGRSARCWLKSSDGSPRPDQCCVSGVKP